MAKVDVLTKAENYGKAQTAFKMALANAANAREGALISLGADITTPGGKVLTPDIAGKMLGGEGLTPGTRLSTGFGEGALPSIAKEQVGTTAEAVQALQERGVGGTSGLAAQQRTISGEAGAIETQKAIQQAQTEIAAATAEQVEAATAEQEAEASYRTSIGQVAKTPKNTAKAAANKKAAAAKKRASARAAANAAATKAGKPKPYGAGGAPKPVPKPGVKPPAPKSKPARVAAPRKKR